VLTFNSKILADVVFKPISSVSLQQADSDKSKGLQNVGKENVKDVEFDTPIFKRLNSSFQQFVDNSIEDNNSS